MPYRPQNTCHDCNYTWYPKGKNVSLRCPRCGSPSVGLVPNVFASLLATPGVAPGCGVLLLCCCGFGLVSSVLQQLGVIPKNEAKVAATDKGKSAEKPPSATPPTVAEPRPSPAPTVRPPEPEPVGSKAAAATADKVPPTAFDRLGVKPGWSSFWQRKGDIEVRVRSLSVSTVQLEDTDGVAAGQSVERLVVVVEVRAVTTDATARPWYGEASHASLWYADGLRVFPAPAGAGRRVVGQPQGERKLVGRGPAPTEVLLFEVPKKPGPLELRLDGDRVGVAGQFIFAVPGDWRMWEAKP